MINRRLWVVACCYALSAREFRLRLDALAAQLGVAFCGVIVDNRGSDLPQNDSNWDYIAGSNRDHDFSAYVEGLEHCVELAAGEPDVMLFLNDSLMTLHAPRVNAKAVVGYADLLARLAVPAICGKADRYAMLCHRNPWSGLPLYVSSYCFLLNHLAYGILRALPDFADTDGLNRDHLIHDNAWGVGLQANFREFIRAYVHYGHSTFVWPGLQRYSIDDRLVSIKARCIYLEHRLSGEIARDGCLIPINARALSRVQLYLAEKVVALRCSLWRRWNDCRSLARFRV